MPSLMVKGRRALKSFTDYWWEEPTPINNKIDTTELVEPDDAEPGQEQLYIVEKLVDKCKYYNSKLRKMVVMYKVKWLGYEEEENTWATEEELTEAKESIQEFEQKRAVARKERRVR